MFQRLEVIFSAIKLFQLHLERILLQSLCEHIAFWLGLMELLELVSFLVYLSDGVLQKAIVKSTVGQPGVTRRLYIVIETYQRRKPINRR